MRRRNLLVIPMLAVVCREPDKPIEIPITTGHSLNVDHWLKTLPANTPPETLLVLKDTDSSFTASFPLEKLLFLRKEINARCGAIDPNVFLPLIITHTPEFPKIALMRKARLINISSAYLEKIEQNDIPVIVSHEVDGHLVQIMNGDSIQSRAREMHADCAALKVHGADRTVGAYERQLKLAPHSSELKDRINNLKAGCPAR